MCTSDQVVKFFEYSPKKQTVLEKLIDETVNDETSRTKLKQLCRTRWVERHDAFSVFLDFFPAIVQTLEHFTKLPNTRTPGAADATSLLYSICNFEFVVAIVIVQMCLAFMKGLSRSLQERSLEVGRALENVNLVQSSLEDCRENVEQFNRKCYERSLKICEPLDIEIKKPRTCGRQTMRDNVQSEGPEDYFRKSITIPFLDYTINEMKTRFTDLHARAALGLQLVPYVMTMLPKLEDFSFFETDLPCKDTLHAELAQWYSLWQSRDTEDRTCTITATLKECDELFFSNVATILRISAVFPVTSCECERSISTLRLLKTYLRSTMSQGRLTSLALMYIHRDIPVNTQKIVADFARRQPRRIILQDILIE
jgi:hypothetical protein